MNIAVLIGEIAFVSENKFIEGLLEAAKMNEANLVLYTCEGVLYEELSEYIAGEYNIFSLINLSEYDGIIVDLDSIRNYSTAELVRNKIMESGIPCVSFNEEIGDSNVISFDNQSGFRVLLEHLIKEHQLTDIVYLDGQKGNRDAIERKELFLEIARENHLLDIENNIYEGKFDYESGSRLIREFVAEKRPWPQAFVAANDNMAIGIISELKRLGVRVPEQVMVTGYDNTETAEFIIPRLTTVDKAEFEAGLLSFELLMQKIKDSACLKNYTVNSKAIIAESCGCKLRHKHDLYNDQSVEMRLNMESSLDLLKGIQIELTNVDNMDGFEQVMKKYIARMGMEFFYFCQGGSRASYYGDLERLASGKDIGRNESEFQETSWCPIAYEDGEWTSYGSFPTKKLFPTNSKYKKKESFYIVMPVHQGKNCIGYSIIGNYKYNLSARVLQHLILSIDNAIGNIWYKDIMNTMLAKINRMWQYDELTGLYNRSGMRVKAEALIAEAKQKDEGIAVIFFDLDGLKIINDTQGHDAGDAYIKFMAEQLLETKQESDVVVRYGGDEYIVLSVQKDNASSTTRMHNYLENIREPIKTSVGVYFEKVSKVDDLRELIENADSIMYENKKKRKAQKT